MINFKKIILDKTERLLRHYPKKSFRALDIGCGDGEWSILLAQRGFSVDSIDKREDRISQLKLKLKKYKNLKNLINIHQQEIKDFSFNKNYYDLIICFNILHLLNKKKYFWTIKKIYNSLRVDCDAFILLKHITEIKPIIINDFCKFDILFVNFFVQNNGRYIFIHLKKPPLIARLKRKLNF